MVNDHDHDNEVGNEIPWSVGIKESRKQNGTGKSYSCRLKVFEIFRRVIHIKSSKTFGRHEYSLNGKEQGDSKGGLKFYLPREVPSRYSTVSRYMPTDMYLPR